METKSLEACCQGDEFRNSVILDETDKGQYLMYSFNVGHISPGSSSGCSLTQ